MKSKNCYDEAIKELEKFLSDAKRNRKSDDCLGIDEKWEGYLQGISGAINRLRMNESKRELYDEYIT